MTADHRPLIYAENFGDNPAFQLTEGKLRDSLGESADDYQIVLRDASAPELERLRHATYFVALRFDTARMREAARAVKLVHCLNAGVERYMPLDWLPADAVLTNSSGVHAGKVGEYGVMALLMLNQQMPALIDRQRQRSWHPRLTMPIRGKTVLIIGTGGLGAAIAEQVRWLGVRVIGVNRAGRAVAGFDSVVPSALLDDALPGADFVVITCPLTSETRGLIDGARIARMKRGAGLVNVARGAIVDTQALLDALASDHLCGAVLDVFDTEPVPEDAPVWATERLIMTPHVSCDTPEGYVERGLAIFADNLARLRRGETLHNVIDRQLGY